MALIESDTTEQSAGLGYMNLVAGTPQDGTWRRTVTIPATAAAGPWTVRISFIEDTLGNSDSTMHRHPTKLTVVNGPTDTTAPVLVSYGFTPKTVDVSTGAQQVTITARITDETGVAAPLALIESDTTEQSAGLGYMNLVAGTPQDGTWRRTVTIPATAAAGPWTVRISFIEDTLGNSDSTMHRHPTKLVVRHGPAPTCDGRAVTVDLALGQKPSHRDDVILGTPGNDTISALGGNDVVCAADGNDVIQGGAGDDVVIGGAGTDTASYVSAVAPVTVSLASVVAQDTGTATGWDTLSELERLWGGNGNDHLTGSDGADLLSGRNGDDVLEGLGGGDALVGGYGTDSCDGGEGDDTAATCETVALVP